MAGEQLDFSKFSNDLSTAHAEGGISEAEQETILKEHEQEKYNVQEACQSNLSELKKYISHFQEAQTLSSEDIKELQKILSVPKNQRNGKLDDTLFAQFLSYSKETGFSGNISELVKKYASMRIDFMKLSLKQRKEMQPEGGKDGEWGQTTFKYLLKQESGTWTVWDKSVPYAQIWDEWASTETEFTEPLPVVESVPADIPPSKTAGEQHPDNIITLWEGQSNTLNETQEEKIFRLKEEAKWFSKSLLRQLQEHLNERGKAKNLEKLSVDWVFWSKSIERLLVEYSDVLSLQEAFDVAGINTDIDGVLSKDGNPEVFRALYGEYIKKLWNDLWLPNGFIEAIIKKETTYGSALVSPTGSHGMMQLTKWPFKDMRGDVWNKIWISHNTVLRYQKIFQKIDFDTLMKIPIWEKWRVQDKIPWEIKKAFYIIQTSQNIAEIQDNITLLFHYIKKNGKDFHDHETNMIIGSVYLAYLHDSSWNDVWQTAYRYNGDAQIANNWKQVRENYANTVLKYFNQLQ